MPLADAADDLSELRALVLTAFEAAHAKGLPHWREMTIGVLKNRLLQATNGEFSERAWGFPNMRQLVRALPEIVVLDQAVPDRVLLKASEEQVPEAAIQVMGQRAMVRPDLWRGIMDYSAGHAWAWVAGAAVEAPPDSADLLPTITPDELGQWRDDFVSGLAGLAVTEADQVASWSRHALTSYALPGHLRGRWNEQLKVNVVERLTTWFSERHESLPADVLVSRGPTPRSAPQQRDPVTSTRAFVEACVAAMTESELVALALPTGVTVRVAAENGHLIPRSS